MIYDKIRTCMYVCQLQCVLVHEDTSIVAIIRNETTAKIIDNNAHRIKQNGCKMTITNFQKNNGQVITSSKSTCEIDYQVVFEVAHSDHTLEIYIF